MHLVFSFQLLFLKALSNLKIKNKSSNKNQRWNWIYRKNSKWFLWSNALESSKQFWIKKCTFWTIIPTRIQIKRYTNSIRLSKIQASSVVGSKITIKSKLSESFFIWLTQLTGLVTQVRQIIPYLHMTFSSHSNGMELF